MAPTLYMIPASPPVRSVLITAKAIGLELDLKFVNVPGGEHLQPDYLKLNPQHTVPTFVDDDGFTFWESHAINAYLVSKYATDDSLYPKDLQKRAIIDQRMHFDSGVAFNAVFAITSAILRDGKTEIDESDRERLNQVYDFLESFLEGKPWVAGDFLSIADYNLFATVTTLNVLVPIDEEKYPNITAWLENVAALPESDANKEGLAAYADMVLSKLV